MTDALPPRICPIRKRPTGIEGFDALTGGLPESRATVLLGGPGAGKTVIALQVLATAVRDRGENAIFVAFEESPPYILGNAEGFGWGLEELPAERLSLVDARLSPDAVHSGAFDLGGLLQALTARAQAIDAKWIVFDALDVLLTLLGDAAAERREIFRLRNWLEASNLTCIITAKHDDSAEDTRIRANFLQFMADCVIQLENRIEDEVALRRLRLIKYRGSGFSENQAPYVIGPNGVEVANAGDISDKTPVSTERVSTGVARLDAMLRGGHLRGSSILMSGSPGTSKSTLCGAFVDAACKRGERCLFLCFDENPGEMVRNLASVNIHLDRHIDAGLLLLAGCRTESRSAEEHLLLIRQMIRKHHPRHVIVDPVSAMLRAGGDLSAMSMIRRLLYATKIEGITLLLTSLYNVPDVEREPGGLQVSTIADTWINLTYVVAGGERNRALSILKARGTAHSNQVRELVLSDDGITLADTYIAGGEVLMGTLRAEREASELRDREIAALAHERERTAAEERLSELELQLASLQRSIDYQRKTLTLFDDQEISESHRKEELTLQRKRMRRSDSNDLYSEGDGK